MKTAAVLLFGLILSFGTPSVAHAKFSMLPSVGAGVGKNYRPSLVGSLRLRESHTPFGIEAFAMMPWGAGAVLSLDAVRTNRLTVKLFDIGIFVPIVGKISATNFDRKVDLVLGSGLVWRPNFQWNGRDIVCTIDWRVFFPDPRLMAKYGDFIRPIFNTALSESFLIIGVGWQ